MRKVLISAAVAVSAMAIAAPAAAQWAPAYGNQYGGQYVSQYGGQYGNPYGNAYGSNNYGQARSLMLRVSQLEQQINQLDRSNVISNRDAGRLRWQANRIQRQIRQESYNGLAGYEARDLQMQIARLEQTIRIQASNGNRWGNRAYGYNNRDGDNRFDRNRDGRDDRYEGDQGRDRDDD